MNNDLLRGVVTKLVHVGSRDGTNQSNHESLYQQGYGLLRGEGGEDVYFIDTVVAGAAFKQMQLGDKVNYLPEDGPFHRAARVEIVRNKEPLEA